ncbi:hypothetical protein AB0I81_62040 [Nonomuraea sp. NPDC050404]|uniref:hypothetical protein n=1 Tax=Nonomuraea sp. NPDC050404 TaxID=3155783 RepID=UPI0034097346
MPFHAHAGGAKDRRAPDDPRFPTESLNAHPRLQDWLAAHLEQDYPALKAVQFGTGVATALVDRRHILPVLDGLDEVSRDLRVRILTALNKSLGERDQLILTSRRHEFEAAVAQVGQPLIRAAVIVPAALTPSQAAEYLRACLSDPPPPNWANVLDILANGTAPALAAFVGTPLGLWLIRTVYLAPCADPSPLAGFLGKDATTLRTHLLERVIPAVVAARPPSSDPADHFRPRRHWDPEVVRRYLVLLARLFPPTTTRDITWWHIACVTPRVRLLAGLAAGLAVGLALWLPDGRVIAGLNLLPHAGVALMGGIGAGIAAGLFWAGQEPGYANLRMRGRLALLFRSLGRRFVVIPLPCIIVLGSMSWSMDRPGLVLLGFTIAAPATVALGLIAWAEKPLPTSSSTPRSTLRADRTLALLRAIASGIVGWLATGIAYVGADGILSVILFGHELSGAFELGFALEPQLAILGLGLGLTLGVMAGKHHAWWAYTIAVAKLVLARQLPWRLMDFLDDVHRLGLLRAVGPVYQFRHALLHDHLAACERAAACIEPGMERSQNTEA